MDDADITGERAEFDLVANLANSRKPIGPQPNGFCLFCEEPVPENHRWCDSSCRDLWEKRK